MSDLDLTAAYEAGRTAANAARDSDAAGDPIAIVVDAVLPEIGRALAAAWRRRAVELREAVGTTRLTGMSMGVFKALTFQDCAHELERLCGVTDEPRP